MGFKLNQRFNNVYVDEKRRMYTPTKVPISVYGESIIKYHDKKFRNWEPSRSKLGAAILKGIPQLGFKNTDTVLYLGCASGTTVSHVSDILDNGVVYALDFAPRVMRDLLFLAENRDNIIPMIHDAKHPERYCHMLKPVDFVFQDIAQREQVEIFTRNVDAFLKKGSYAMLCVKARSIDVARKPKDIFNEVRQQLSSKLKIVDFRTLEPFEDDHMMILCQN